MKALISQLLEESTAKPAAESRADKALMAKVGAALFAAGASLTLIWLLAIPHPSETNELGLAGQAGASYATAAIVLVAYKYATWWTYQLFSAWATVLVTIGVYFAGESIAVAGLFFVWVNQFSFYFYTRIQAALQLGFIGICYGAALLLQGVPATDALTRWVVTMGTLMVVGVLVWALRARVKDLVARLAEAARTDSLTDLLNRRGFEEAFDLELERIRRTGRSLGLVVCDIDHFKQVNDRLGHHAGDGALEHVGEVLRRTKRRIDTAARIGGEEFALILPEADEHGAYSFAERLRAEVERSFETEPVALTISLGVASSATHGATAQQLMHAADRALYAAKALGRDCTVVYSPEISTTVAAGPPSSHDEYLTSVLHLADVLGIRDARSARHCERVGRYAEMTASSLGLADDIVQRLRLAGVLHDLGKVFVPDSVLHKSDSLTEKEWATIKQHPEMGAEVLDGANVDDIRDWVLAHQERLDGQGYPHGLSGDEIPLEARILTVADAYEAMTGGRAYQDALSHEEASERLRDGAGAQFDPEVVEALLQSIEQKAAGLPLRETRSRSPR